MSATTDQHTQELLDLSGGVCPECGGRAVPDTAVEGPAICCDDCDLRCDRPFVAEKWRLWCVAPDMLQTCKDLDEAWHILHDALKRVEAEEVRTPAIDLLNDLQDHARDAIAKVQEGSELSDGERAYWLQRRGKPFLSGEDREWLERYEARRSGEQSSP